MTRRAARVLVTGGTGFLGSHLVRRLVEEGADVHVFARAPQAAWRLRDLEGSLTFWEGDLRQAASVEGCVRGARPSVVFHAAGETAGRRFEGDWTRVDESLEVNLQGTVNLLRAVHRGAPGLRSLVRLGGLEEYGRGRVPYTEDQREMPISPYSASQVAATHFAQMLHHSLGLPVVTLRPALVYGPAQATTFLVPALILACLKGEDFAMTSGEQTRELVYVRDVVGACLRAAETKAAAGEVINVGSGEARTVREIGEEVRRLVGGPSALKLGAVARTPGEVERLVCDPGRGRHLLKWTAVTRLEHGLRETIEWYRHHPSAS